MTTTRTTMQLVRAMVLLVVMMATRTVSQANSGGGPSALFNDFINDNSIVDTSTTSSSSSESASSPSLDDDDDDTAAAFSSSSLDLASGRNEDRLYRMRQRSRNHRLQSLRFQILQRLGMDQPPSVTISPETRNRVMESLDRFPALTQYVHPLHNTDRRCYSASCNVPHKVNETLWRNSSYPGLRLFVPVPRDRNNEAPLQSATLHLFLKPNALRQEQCDCDGEDGEEGNTLCRSVNGFLVQVYQYVRPLSIRRRGRVVNRRRLLDAKFVPVSGNAWISLNIRNVASDWRRHRRNFGVEVTIKDDNDTQIDAKTMFVLPDCTVGREIGCREGSGTGISHSLPWLVDFADNFPYVDLVAVRSSSAPSRSRRSLRQTQRHHHHKVTQHIDASSSLVASPRPSCLGEMVVINVTDSNVEKPKSFASRICPTTCWDCPNDQQCPSRPCSAPMTEAVVGRYRSHNGVPVHKVLPFTRVIACGC